MTFLGNIGKYQLSRLLEISSSLSKRLFNNEESVVKIYRYDQSRFIRGGYRLAKSAYLLPWFLVDISYYAIKCSNDFKAIIPSNHDFMNLYDQFLKYDEYGVTIDKPGNMSMNLGGVRWTLYPEWSRKLDPEGPKMVTLPLPGWDKRMNWPKLVTTTEELERRIKMAKDHPEWAEWGMAGK